jgi:hypothetical protein
MATVGQQHSHGSTPLTMTRRAVGIAIAVLLGHPLLVRRLVTNGADVLRLSRKYQPTKRVQPCHSREDGNPVFSVLSVLAFGLPYV